MINLFLQTFVNVKNFKSFENIGYSNNKICNKYLNDIIDFDDVDNVDDNVNDFDDKYICGYEYENHTIMNNDNYDDNEYGFFCFLD